jgi:hypothetical protein
MEPRADANRNLAVAGYVSAVLLPLIGLVIGLILNRRDDPRGLRIMWLATAIIALGLLIRVTVAA